MSARTLLPLALIGTAGLGLVVWQATRPAVAAPSTRGDAPQLRWPLGMRQGFELEVKTEVATSGGAAGATPERWRHRLRARLSMQVRAADAAGVQLSCELREVDQRVDDQPAPGFALQTHFGIQASRDGRLQAFEFPPGTSAEIRGQVRGLMELFQVCVPIEAGETWRCEEPGQAGTWQVIYRRNALGDLQRSRLKLAPVSGRAEVLRSKAEVSLANEGLWLQRIDFDEEIRQLRQDQQHLRSRSVGYLLATGPEPVWQQDLRSMLTTAAAQRRKAEEQAEATRLAERPPMTEAVRQRFVAILRGLDGKAEVGKELDLLRDLLLEYPELAALVPDLLRHGGHSDLSQASLIHALSMAGNAASQRALGRIALNPEQTQTNRIRATIDLGAIRKVADHCLEDLWSLSRRTGSAADRECADTASLALGRLGRQLRSKDDPRYPQLRAELQRSLQSSSRPSHRSAWLRAAGNTADPSLRDPLRPHLHDRDSIVRSAAATALGRIPGSAPLLSERLTQERSARVRARLAEGLLRQEAKDPDTLRKIARDLTSEQSPRARLAMARLLGQNLETHPGARETLRNHLRSESSKEVRAYLTHLLHSKR